MLSFLSNPEPEFVRNFVHCSEDKHPVLLLGVASSFCTSKARPFSVRRYFWMSLWEKPERLYIKEEEPDIAWKYCLGRTVHDLHLPTESLEVHLCRGLVKLTANSPEEGADETEIEIGQGGTVVHPVIEAELVEHLPGRNFSPDELQRIQENLLVNLSPSARADVLRV